MRLGWSGRACPHLLSSMCPSTASRRICSMILPGTDRSVVPGVLLSTLWKNGCSISPFLVTTIPFQVSWRVAWKPHQPCSGMHLFRSYRVMDVQVLQVLSNLTFSCSERDFAAPVPPLWNVRREAASKDRGKKVPQPPSHQFLPVCRL